MMKKAVSLILVAVICIFGLVYQIGNTAAESADNGSAVYGTFIGNREVNATLTPYGYSEWLSFFGWYYVRATVPEGIGTSRVDERITIRKENDPSGTRHRISGAVVEFVSGSESLRDALVFDVWNPGSDDMQLNIRAAKEFTEPGDAVFRFRVESEDGLYAEAERTLRVLSWEDYPQYEFLNEDHTGNAKLGTGDLPPGWKTNSDGHKTMSSRDMIEYGEEKKYNNLYTEAQVLELALKDHTMEIASMILPQSEIKYLYKRVWVSPMAVNEEGEYIDDNDNPNLYTGGIKDQYGINSENTYSFRAYGEYIFSVFEQPGGASARISILVSPYGISGPTALAPGGKGTYTTWDEQPEQGRSFTFSVEGEGAEFDPETNTLTVSEETPEGTVLTLQAVPSDGGTPARLTCRVRKGLLSDEQFRDGYRYEGFSLPVPAEDNKYSISTENGSLQAYYIENDQMLLLSYYYYTMNQFCEEEDVAEKCYNEAVAAISDIEQMETIQIDGHPARLAIWHAETDSGRICMAQIYYARNNVMAIVGVTTGSMNGESGAEVTMSDLYRLAGMIKYDPSQASITVADVELTVTPKEKSAAITAGKNLQFTAAFANTDFVNQKNKNNGITWSVTDTATGKTPDYAKISNKGQLSVDRKLADVREIQVTATSDFYGTSADYRLTAIPAVKSLAAEPKEVTLYAGSAQTATLTAVITPDTVPVSVLSWKSQNEKTVRVEPKEDGTAMIRPAAAGNTTVQVKEPGGKSANVRVKVLEPVTAVELTVRGKAKAGGKVTVSAALTPKNAGNKNLEWSVNVPEDVATVSAKGQVTISRNASAGTVITVTCRAVGAPEPVTAETEITVE